MGNPTSTYRIQLRPDFPFAAAQETVPYAASLGVSHLHLSPVLEAVPGSGHGYDVTDHSGVRAEFGGEEGLRALSGTARAHGLGLILDIVPNHMAVPSPVELNGPLWEVLRDGPASRRARWFDIDWEAGDGRLLLPVLAGPLAGELPALSVSDGVLHYGPQRFPLRPGTGRLPMAELLRSQHYRLAWWRLARTELNYRRFFSISELIGVRVEDPEVFEATHRTVLGLLDEGVIDGLRVDHPDGLADPAGYLRRLHERGGGAWTVVEKILGPDERLPVSWPVAGTTGYDTLRHIGAVLTDPEGAERMTGHYREFTQAPDDTGGQWEATVRRAAREVIDHELAAERDRLVRVAERVCQESPALRMRDHARWALRTAVTGMLVRLPVYRPYVPAGGRASAVDERLLGAAAEGARSDFAVEQEAAAVETVHALALGRLGGAPGMSDFRVRFAQVAAALHAKAVEDTAFYRYPALLSATEVGCDPGRPSVSPDAFHAHCARLQRDWPHTGTVLSTHDTKRSADVRAALTALTEDPDGWAELVVRLTRDTAWRGAAPPDPQLAWAAWQTAFGLGTPDAGRLRPALLKAAREAGLHTSWTEPDAAYEDALARFTESGPCGPPHRELDRFAGQLAPQVRAVMLGGALLHLTVPGVPDVYRGSESDYRALVDPDNRRLPPLPADRLAALDSGRPPATPAEEKLRLTAVALRLRRKHPEWFGEGAGYLPLRAEGPASAHCLAFARGGNVVAAVTRLSRRLAADGGWRGTRLDLPGGRWRDALTGRNVQRSLAASELFADAPVALLVRDRN
ncbi:malto-oligosyltrehalose synthase [Streptomyces sodiiphilus]|uniref:Malto-oligosyltrehalose synthase n=1 Tax=Streptomyces sodiiphilus TaxID=226217 RepID=A0ABN2P671_9ACTN